MTRAHTHTCTHTHSHSHIPAGVLLFFFMAIVAVVRVNTGRWPRSYLGWRGGCISWFGLQKTRRYAPVFRKPGMKGVVGHVRRDIFTQDCSRCSVLFSFHSCQYPQIIPSAASTPSFSKTGFVAHCQAPSLTVTIMLKDGVADSQLLLSSSRARRSVPSKLQFGWPWRGALSSCTRCVPTKVRWRTQALVPFSAYCITRQW